MATVWVPSPLLHLTRGAKTIGVDGRTVKELVVALDRIYPGVKDAITKDGILLKPSIAVVVDGTIVQLGLLHPVAPDSEVHFIPAMAGG